MLAKLSTWAPVTVALLVLAALALIGGIVCAAISGAALHRYTQLAGVVWKYAAALGALGIGRGIHLGLTGAAQTAGDAHARATIGDLTGLSQGVKAAGYQPPETPEAAALQAGGN